MATVNSKFKDYLSRVIIASWRGQVCSNSRPKAFMVRALASGPKNHYAMRPYVKAKLYFDFITLKINDSKSVH